MPRYFFDIIDDGETFRDELGAELARAMGRRKGDPERVTMAQFHRALEHGIDSVPDAPVALRRFFAVVDEVPEWVDFDLLEHGARALRRDDIGVLTPGARADLLILDAPSYLHLAYRPADSAGDASYDDAKAHLSQRGQ